MQVPVFKSSASKLIDRLKKILNAILKFRSKSTNFRSLKVNLALAFLGLSTVVLLVSSSLNMYSNLQNNRKVAADQQKLIAKEAANTVKGFIQEKFGMLAVTASIGDLITVTSDEQKLVLNKLFGLEPSFRQLILLNAQGKELCRTTRLSKFALNKSAAQQTKEIFNRANKVERYISSIYIDETTYEPMLLLTVSIRNLFGDFKGMLIAEVNLKFMWDLVGSMQIGKKGQAYVVDREGNLIAAKDVGRVLKGENLSRLKKVSEFINSKTLFTVSKADISKGIEGTQVVVSFTPLVDPDWAVLVELPVSEAYEQARIGFIISLLIMVFSFILAVVVGIYLSRTITKPIINLMDATRTISKGDLTMRINLKSHDEIGELALNFNQMVTSLGTLIINSKQAIKVILEQSAALKDSSYQSVQTSEAVAIAMQQISRGTSDQTVETEKTANQMNDLAREIDSVVSNANEVETITGHAKELSLKSKAAIHLLTEKAKETEEITRIVTNNINDFIESMQKIQSVTAIITEITEQTNLLALNAAIEAARAGKAGRGFAIVAEEMNKLAYQSREAAKTISDTIVAVHDQTIASMKSSDKAHLIVEEQMNSVITARDSFDEIVKAMDGIIERNLKMIETIKNINDYKERTVNSIMAISSVSEETAASSEEVLASTEEQTAIAEQVKEMADNMLGLAENLVKITDAFVVNEE